MPTEEQTEMFAERRLGSLSPDEREVLTSLIVEMYITIVQSLDLCVEEHVTAHMRTCPIMTVAGLLERINRLVVEFFAAYLGGDSGASAVTESMGLWTPCVVLVAPQITNSCDVAALMAGGGDHTSRRAAMRTHGVERERARRPIKIKTAAVGENK